MKFKKSSMIKPRCLLYNMPMFLSADNHLKPCCLVNPTEEWQEFVAWAKQNGLDAEYDLDITKHSIDDITQSPTWLAVIDGFKTGNVPPECHRSCGPNSYVSDTNTAKHNTYK